MLGVRFAFAAAAAAAVFAVLWWRARQRHKELALRLDARQDQFDVLAHEIKTPLSLISLAVEMLLDETAGPLTRDQVAFTQEIHQSSARVNLLADNILTESKLQAGFFSPTMAPVDVRDIVREVWRSMRRLAEQRNQKIALEYPQMMDPVLADAALLRQAVTNLVQNAIRHTSIGGVVTLSAFQNDREAVIAVWDDGAGMTPQERKRAFQRFVSHTGGTGLGLTIVETIAALHGGAVKVDTSLGRGAAFLVILPRRAK